MCVFESQKTAQNVGESAESEWGGRSKGHRQVDLASPAALIYNLLSAHWNRLAPQTTLLPHTPCSAPSFIIITSVRFHALFPARPQKRSFAPSSSTNVFATFDFFTFADGSECCFFPAIVASAVFSCSPLLLLVRCPLNFWQTRRTMEDIQTCSQIRRPHPGILAFSTTHCCCRLPGFLVP